MHRPLNFVIGAALIASPLLASNAVLARQAPAPQPAGREGAPPAARGGQGRGPAGPSGPGRSNNPFPDPIPATDGVIKVNFVEFATVPNAGADAPRMNLLLDEPGTHRMFVNTMQGMLYSVSYDGKTVKPYLNISDPQWDNPVQFAGTERGFQSFAFHPQFAQTGTPGYGKFYTWADTTNMTPQADFVPLGAGHTHDEILLEWTAKDPMADAYDGGAPRELFRVAHPFANHNGGEIAFNPLARRGTPEFGLLYIGSADGGSGGDPYNHAQNLKSVFGKILRIDPLGHNSPNGHYGIPANNPFAKNSAALGEIYSYGHRNPQRFSWDPKNGNMFEAEIGQNVNEEINQVVAGGNYGWNIWEGSFKYFGREVSIEGQRQGEKMIFPIVEFDHTDPLFASSRLAATGIYVYRETAIKQLTGMLLFGDNPSGEVFYLNADKLPNGGQAFHRVLFNDKGETKTFLQLVKDKSAGSTRSVTRADLRMGVGPKGQLFLMDKYDGTIRLLVP
ncbi:MAG TPA: PQQ-dependent sugar dehydrogenase [Vicinamibacterales bacterium]